MQGNRSYLVLFATTAWLLFCPAVLAVTSIASEYEQFRLRRGERSSSRWPAGSTSCLAAEWKAAGVAPAPTAADGEFLRRAYLDLTGVIPRVSEVREFLADERPDKREQLVDRLLASPRYATHMATTWRNRILPLGVDPERSREAVGLQKWLRTRFAKNLRYDNLVGGLLLTIGGDELGPGAVLPGQRSVAGKNGRQRGRVVPRREARTAPSATTIRSPIGRSATSGAWPRSSPA